MNRQQVYLLLFLMGFFGASPVSAYLAGGDISLRLSIIQIDKSGRGELLCASEMAVISLAQGSWSLVKPLVDEEADARASSLKVAICKEDSGQAAVQKLAEGRSATGDLSPQTASSNEGIARIRIMANLNRQMEDEKLLLLNVEILKEEAARRSEGEASQPEILVKRALTFSDDTVSYLPFEIIDEAGIDEAAAQQFYLRLESVQASTDRQERHGTIYLHSDHLAASVLLDDGEVGQVSRDGEFLVGWVEPGFRKVSVRSKSGEEYAQFVEVKPARTHLLRFEARKKSGRQIKRISLEISGVNDQGYTEYVRGIDQAVLVLIPEGEFLMGNERTERTPFEHLVYLSSFLIDKKSVTWRQYNQFIAEAGKSLPLQKPYWGINDDHPAVFVSWSEARSYCQWVGGRLPTEAEREKAARGTDQRLYPWGEEAPTPELGVFRSSWGNEATQPVGIRPLGASPYGVLDMGGNVWEWCSDWYSDEYLEMSPYKNPAGPVSGTKHVVRGGSWDSRPEVLSASCRNWGHPGYREGDFGFRCAMNAPPD